MKQISIILDKLLAIAKDLKVWLRVLVLAVACFAGAILFSRTKTNNANCISCESERGQLIQALLEIRRELQPTEKPEPISYNGGTAAYFMFSSFIDTTPAQHKQIQQKQQQQVIKVVNKIDSILFKIKAKQLIEKTKT